MCDGGTCAGDKKLASGGRKKKIARPDRDVRRIC